MSTQIAVRVDDDQMEFLDRVAARRGISRAAVVRRALDQLRREEGRRDDLAALAGAPHDALDEIRALAGAAAAHLPALEDERAHADVVRSTG